MNKDISNAFNNLQKDIEKSIPFVNAGGCGIFANMILDIFVDAELYAVLYDCISYFKNPYFNHIIIKIDGKYYDSQGEYSTENKIIMNRLEFNKLVAKNDDTIRGIIYPIFKEELIEWLNMKVWNPMFAGDISDTIKLIEIIDKHFYKFKFPILSNLNNDLVLDNNQIPESQENVLNLTK